MMSMPPFFANLIIAYGAFNEYYKCMKRTYRDPQWLKLI